MLNVLYNMLSDCGLHPRLRPPDSGLHPRRRSLSCLRAQWRQRWHLDAIY